MEKNKGKFFIGRIKDFSAFRGFFIGHFMGEKGFPLLDSKDVEIAWKKIPEFKPEEKSRHLHKKSIEINIVISGWVKVEINNEEFKIKEGEFFVIHPFTVVEDLEAGEDTEMIVVKAPSISGEKYSVNR